MIRNTRRSSSNSLCGFLVTRQRASCIPASLIAVVSPQTTVGVIPGQLSMHRLWVAHGFAATASLILCQRELTSPWTSIVRHHKVLAPVPDMCSRDFAASSSLTSLCSCSRYRPFTNGEPTPIARAGRYQQSEFITLVFGAASLI
jgi:hypothetical protein